MREAYVFEQNRRLGRGVNILGYDPVWRLPSRARMKDKHFALIKQADLTVYVSHCILFETMGSMRKIG
jgi:hypothetical protein